MTPAEYLQSLFDRGFDESSYNEEAESFRVRCSQCEALVINTIPCHETGCPNDHDHTEHHEDEFDDRDQESPIESMSYDNHNWDADPDWGP